MLELQLLLLLLVANGAPILARNLMGSRFTQPLDGGRRLADGQPLFGAHKTYRGIATALLATAIAAPMLRLDPGLGLTLATGAMLGDLFSSFLKRRFHMAPGGMALGLDQIPEALLPLVIVCWWLDIGWEQIVVIVALFMLLELVLSRLAFRWRIRQRPY